MGRSADDYGIPGLSDQTLQLLASNPKMYGEKSRFAAQEMAQRQGVLNQADQYRAALQKAAYGDAGQQYGQGINQITNYLAGAGPLADSGAATALRAKLASQIYGAAQGRINQGYASYLGNALNARRQYNYQRSLMQYQRNLNKPSMWSQIAGIAGGVGGALLGGPAGAAVGYGIGNNVGSGFAGGGGQQASDAYYG